MIKSALATVVFLLYLFVSSAAKASCELDQNKEFDFWLGSWKVSLPDGTHAGDNKIEKIQQGCALRENWSSARSGFTGTSINFYNQSSKQWEQIWVDNQGSSLHLKGQRIANQMILTSDPAQDDSGNLVSNQITWTKNEDGTVRQLWLSKIQGQADKVLFDGLYKQMEK